MNLHTLLRGKTALAMALCAAACSQFSSAQVAPPVILQIDLTNNVLYFQDTSDISKYATEPNVTPLTAQPAKLPQGRRYRRHCGSQWPANEGDLRKRRGGDGVENCAHAWPGHR